MDFQRWSSGTGARGDVQVCVWGGQGGKGVRAHAGGVGEALHICMWGTGAGGGGPGGVQVGCVCGGNLHMWGGVLSHEGFMSHGVGGWAGLAGCSRPDTWKVEAVGASHHHVPPPPLPLSLQVGNLISKQRTAGSGAGSPPPSPSPSSTHAPTMARAGSASSSSVPAGPAAVVARSTNSSSPAWYR